MSSQEIFLLIWPFFDCKRTLFVTNIIPTTIIATIAAKPNCMIAKNNGSNSVAGLGIGVPIGIWFEKRIRVELNNSKGNNIPRNTAIIIPFFETITVY